MISSYRWLIIHGVCPFKFYRLSILTQVNIFSNFRRHLLSVIIVGALEGIELGLSPVRVGLRYFAFILVLSLAICFVHRRFTVMAIGRSTDLSRWFCSSVWQEDGNLFRGTNI